MLKRPTQAVILAGGRGTRLMPLTKTLPKPMVSFHGKPFLEYLIESVRDQGFERILLLLGYLPSAIQDYFGDGSEWGVRIEYSITDVHNETGRRIKLAQSLIDPVFLLMYCDNYWPMRFDRMWSRYEETGAEVQLTVYRNKDNYTRHNVQIDDKGRVVQYDRDWRAKHLEGVDIGFALLKRGAIDLLPDNNVSFENTVYNRFLAARKLYAFVTEHRYYSVGGHDRLELTRDFLKRRPTVLVDRDGVLNKKMAPSEYVRSWKDWSWLPGSRKALAMFREKGYRVVVVSNQAGVARGVMSQDDLTRIHERMTAEVEQARGHIDSIYACTHGWDEGCECRKPKPGLLFAAQRDLSLDLSRTVFIGDDDRDQMAADAAGCPSLKVTPQQQLIDHARRIVASAGSQGQE